MVCAVTIHKDEVESMLWDKLCEHPVKHAMELLEVTGSNVQILGAPWRQSWWGELGKTTPSSAISLQMHMRVPKNKLGDLLRSSGRNSIYLNPKNVKGIVDTSFAIIWSDQSLVDL